MRLLPTETSNTLNLSRLTAVNLHHKLKLMMVCLLLSVSILFGTKVTSQLARVNGIGTQIMFLSTLWKSGRQNYRGDTRWIWCWNIATYGSFLFLSKDYQVVF